MGFDERAELRQAILAFAGSRKDHGLVGSVQVDEDGNIVVASFGGGLVQADCLEALQVQRGDGFSHIMMDDAPQALVSDLNVPGHGVDRNLADKAHDHLLKKQGETAAFPGPRGLHSSDSVFRAIDPRQ